MSSPAVCLVCGQPAELDRVLGTLARCRTCGFVTWPQAPPDPAALYNEQYFTRVDYPDYLGNESALRRSMVRHLHQMTHYWCRRGALLEIGSAYGFFLDEARNHFDRVVGVDVAAPVVERAGHRFGVEVHAGEFLELPFEEATFDIVCLWDTVEHLPRPDHVLAKARRLLRPEGRLFLTTGDLSSLNARMRGARWRQIHPPSHLHYFSRDTMSRLLERVGFRVLEFETSAYYHSVHNVLATLRLRGGSAAGVSHVVLRALGDGIARRMGFWINLGDIMFVAAAPNVATLMSCEPTTAASGR